MRLSKRERKGETLERTKAFGARAEDTRASPILAGAGDAILAEKHFQQIWNE